MGRKYRELKERMLGVRSRHLLVIDDQKIRMKAYKEIEKTLKKIENLEDSIQSFETTDQGLFNDWTKLTFADRQSTLESLHQQLSEMGIFHNRVIALSDLEEMAIWLAYSQVKSEQDLHKNGTIEEKNRIEKLWKERDEYVLRQAYRNEDDFEDFDVEAEVWKCTSYGVLEAAWVPKLGV